MSNARDSPRFQFYAGASGRVLHGIADHVFDGVVQQLFEAGSLLRGPGYPRIQLGQGK